MPEDKMTVERIVEEYGIGKDTVRTMFKDPKIPVQTYTKPFFVLRTELIKYFCVRHDYLKGEDTI